MATSIGTYYGNSVGPYGKFRVVCQLRYSSTDSSKGWYVQRRFYVQVTTGESKVWTSTLLPSWTSTRYALSTAGTYADTEWKNVGWIAYGSAVSYSCSAQYTGGSGTVYKSYLSGNYTVPKPTYKVTYDANGGSGAPGIQTKTYDKDLTLSSTKPTRTGYKFVKWNTKSDGSGTSYDAGATYTGNAALTLYAIWSIITYKVSYNANGGSGAPGSQTKTYGKDLTLSGTKPTLTGYKFVKWNTKSDGSGTSYDAGATYTANAALTLYAMWEIEANCYVKVNQTYVMGLMYVKQKGTYKRGTVTVKNGTYKNTSM